MRWTLGVVGLVCAGCHGDKPATKPSAQTQPVTRAVAPAVTLDPSLPLRIESLGSPMRSARTWTTALVQNKRGGWNFVAQVWEHESTNPVEYVVLDLGTGRYTVRDAQFPRYANTNIQISNQLLAPNGRVFFPLSQTGLAYYEPADETVRELPSMIPPPGTDVMMFSYRFGPDGMLYGGTQNGALPAIVQIDPVKLTTRVVGRVGRDRKTYSYAYRIAVDPPWVYAVVGELPWELAALNMKTGESKVLATRTDHAWMDLRWKPEGWQAQLISGLRTDKQINDYVWLVDGKTIPVEGDSAPFKSHHLIPDSNDSAAANAKLPEVDVAPIDPNGVGKVRWRLPGEKAWKTSEFKVNHTTPIPIEALTAMPDGGILGAGAQYHGFFRTDGATSTYLGGPSPSRSHSVVLDGLVYTTGYPNGVLYVYDATKPWTGTTEDNAALPGSNPFLLGNFTQAAAKYGSFLTASARRVYFAGRRERDGEGSGIGYYDPKAKKFGGHNDGLGDFAPTGLAVLPTIGRVVFSGQLRDGVQVPQAELVVHDEDLTETERLVVKPGLKTTGEIFATTGDTVIVGILPDALYRYDIAARKLLAWKSIAKQPDAIAVRRSDGSIWVVMGTSLARIDPRTLDVVTFGQAPLPQGVNNLAWQNDDLYAATNTELFRISRVGLP